MLKVGDSAPSIEATNHDGSHLSIATPPGHPVILFFYPRARSPGCTIETKGFSETFEEFQRRGVTVIGVSTDPIERQHRFAEECDAKFPIIADTDRSIAREFGVLGILGMARRVTFLIGPDGRITEVVEGMRPGPHVEAAVRRFSPKGSEGGP